MLLASAFTHFPGSMKTVLGTEPNISETYPKPFLSLHQGPSQ